MTGIKVISTNADDAQLKQRGVPPIEFYPQNEYYNRSDAVFLVPQTNISEKTKIWGIEYQELEAGQSEKRYVALSGTSDSAGMYLVFDTTQVDTIIWIVWAHVILTEGATEGFPMYYIWNFK